MKYVATVMIALMLASLALNSLAAPVENCSGEHQFQIEKGTLKSNIERIIAAHYQGALLVYEVGHHGVFVDSCIEADSANALVQQMIEPYTSPQRIYFMTFRNGVAAVFYQNDSKYSQYLRVAR